MDANRFDQIVRTLTAAGTRRSVLGFITSLPLVGGLAALLSKDEANADGRRRRRKKRHKHGRPRTHGKHKKMKCKAKSKAKTCAGTCGQIKNNCKKTVDCGACVCDPPCPVCQICDENTGACASDPEQLGDDCGEPGQRCQADGACACDASSCDLCETCQENGACSDPCGGEGCCASGTCEDGTSDTACGSGGDPCSSCTGTGVTCGGGGQPGVCGCTPTTCEEAGKNCGTIPDGCGEALDCESCGSNTPICVNNVCTACSPENPCPNGGCCTGSGACLANGATCDDGNACTTGDTCQNGACAGTAVACNSPTECQNGPGACLPANGQCSYTSKVDGTRCGNKCSQSCAGGVCGAGTEVICSASICQIPGTCDPSSGTCSAPTNKPSGTSCASSVPCGVCDDNGACVGCTGTDCCGLDGQCHENLQSCNPNGNEICCGGQCTCSVGGNCRISPNGAICCCTDPDQICVDVGSGGNCEFPP